MREGQVVECCVGSGGHLLEIGAFGSANATSGS